MFVANKRHLRKVILYGGLGSAALAGLSLLKFPPVVAASVLAGAALGILNIFSIVRVVEALAGAAAAGAAPGRASKVLSVGVHVVKLVLIAAILVVLVYYRLIKLLPFIVGFTVILVINLFAGLSGLSQGNTDAP